MLPDQLQKLEEVIEAGCQKHIAAGGTIIFGRFSDGDKGASPVFASIDPKVLDEVKVSDRVQKIHYALVKALGFKLSEQDLLAIEHGHAGITNDGGDKQAYALGKKLREKYIKEEETNDSDGAEHKDRDQG